MTYQPALDAFKKARRRASEKHLSKSCDANVVIQWEDGSVSVSSNQVCHAGLRDARGKFGKPSNLNVKWILSGIQCLEESYSKGHINMIRHYMDWLLKESPWQGVFHTKDVSWCLENECVIVNPEVPPLFLISAMMCHRRVWEHTSVMENFYHLTKEGNTNRTIAFVLSHFFVKCEGNLVPQSFMSSSNHSPFFGGSFCYRSLNNLIKGVYRGKYDGFYSKKADYNHGVSSIFDINKNNRLIMYEIQYAEWEGSESKSKNPFKKESTKTTVNYQDGIKHIKDFIIPKIEQELKNA